MFTSSNASERPWPGMAVYAASKAALNTFVVGWNTENPALGATRVTVGPTASTMSRGWDPELGARLREQWAAGGYLGPNPAVQEPEDVALAICNVLRSRTRVTEIRVVPPGV